MLLQWLRICEHIIYKSWIWLFYWGPCQCFKSPQNTENKNQVTNWNVAQNSRSKLKHLSNRHVSALSIMVDFSSPLSVWPFWTRLNTFVLKCGWITHYTHTPTFDAILPSFVTNSAGTLINLESRMKPQGWDPSRRPENMHSVCQESSL